jgi:triosephosphate isomerase
LPEPEIFYPITIQNMRKRIVAGNWKMNKTLQEGMELAVAVNAHFEKNPTDVEVIIAPPFIHLADAARKLSVVGLGAQNCASESSGAYTGEVSAQMIRSTGARYVIIGHSERRTYFREEDTLLNRKIKLAFEQELFPIFCCGELLPQREAGKHFAVVREQIETALFPLNEDEISRVVLAYEPVWAIGTGVNASPAQAQEMHAFIRGLLREHYGDKIAGDMSILYGGSCKPSNAGELFANPDVDGGLIGGASLSAGDFIAIAESF